MEAVQVFYQHLGNIMDALKELNFNPLSNPETKAEAAYLIKSIEKFEFVVITCFWYKLLRQIDRVNKLLQKEDVTLHESVRHIHGLVNLLQSTRESITNEAKEISERNGINAGFKELRKRKKRKMVDENCDDETFNLSERDKFRISMLEIVDNILTEFRERFQSMEKLNGKFSFLHGA